MANSPTTPANEAPAAAAQICVLDVKGLKTHFRTREGTLRALEGVSFAVAAGEILGVVGESGCGKSITAASILRILPPEAHITDGEILFRTRNGEVIDLAQLKPRSRRIRQIRGDEISMVFQEPMTAFSPVHTIGNQIMEALRLHQRCTPQRARKRAIDMLSSVGMPRPQQLIDSYPFELSGGMRQRAMIAMALVCQPRMLIADEPTTALDVTIEAQILQLMRELQDKLAMAIMIITHDLSVVAEMSRNVLVMYLGQDVEYGTVEQIFFEPKHPYTRELLASVPRLGKKSGERLHTIKGTVPSLYERPKGCTFHPRCPDCISGLCDTQAPGVFALDGQHRVRCHLYRE